MSKIQYQQKPTNQSQPETQAEQPSYERKPYNNRRDNQNTSSYGKPRYQDKQSRYKNKHGFEYDENKISYNTEIPEMPQKQKQKPDEVRFNKKIDELQNKVKELKRSRKQKKDSYKNGSKTFTEQIEKQKHNIDLAKACLVVLNFDKNNLNKEIDEVQFKINTHKRKVDYLSRTSHTPKTTKIDEMNYADLIMEEERITHEMSTRNLSKVEEVELSNKLNKIKKRKTEVPKQTVTSGEHDKKSDEIQTHKKALEKLKTVRETLTDKITDIDNKIESIEDAIQDFQEAIEEIHDKLRNTDNSKLLEQAAELKQQIYAIWDEIEQLKEQQKTKIDEWEQEQQKVKYIQWAKDVKAKKAEAWQLEKQQRKKTKLREKERTKKDQKPTKDGEKKPGDQQAQTKPAFERTKINRNQKEIDACAFLIQYCKDLNVGASKTEDKTAEQKEVKLEDALKKGEWAKMKNVQVIQSKKKKADEQAQQKTFKKRDIKNISSQPVDKFSHTYFVAQVFDSVKVLPPAKPEELEKLITDLEDKMEYYVAHPDEEVGRSLLPGKQVEKETRGKGPRRIINTEEFPSLR